MPGMSAAGEIRAVREIASRSAAVFFSSSARRFRHASSIAAISFRNCGLGKYVPP